MKQKHVRRHRLFRAAVAASPFASSSFAALRARIIRGGENHVYVLEVERILSVVKAIILVYLRLVSAFANCPYSAREYGQRR